MPEVAGSRDGLRCGAFSAFLNDMAEHNAKVVWPKCGKVQDLTDADIVKRASQAPGM